MSAVAAVEALPWALAWGAALGIVLLVVTAWGGR